MSDANLIDAIRELTKFCYQIKTDMSVLSENHRVTLDVMKAQNADIKNDIRKLSDEIIEFQRDRQKVTGMIKAAEYFFKYGWAVVITLAYHIWNIKN